MTYEKYRAAVVADIVRQTGWTSEEASDITGDIEEMQTEGLDPDEAAGEILAACDPEETNT